MQPNFLIIGAPKAATTWLANCLREHPQVHIPEAKELRYFCGGNYARGDAWYRQQFRGGEGCKVIGEASPSYLGSSGAPDRIRACLPGVKLIVSLRHPVEQAYSFYWHLLSRGQLPQSLGFPRFFAEQRPRAGFYGHHLRRYLDVFGCDQMLVLLYEEDILADPLRGLRRTQGFLDIDTHHTPTVCTSRSNQARGVPMLDRPLQLARRGVNRLPARLRRAVKRAGKSVLATLPARRPYVPLDCNLRQQLLEQHCLADLKQLEDAMGLDLNAWYRG